MSRLVQAIQPMISKGVSIPIRHEYRVKVRELDPEVRKRMFEEVEKPISVEEAYHEDGDRVLLLESCSHHTSCDDIGRVKIPRWISLFTGKKLNFEVVAGLDDVPGAIQDYALVVQCGGCMATRRQLINRLRPAREAGIPVTNYGMAIAYVQGVYERAVAPFVSSNDPGATYL